MLAHLKMQILTWITFSRGHKVDLTLHQYETCLRSINREEGDFHSAKGFFQLLMSSNSLLAAPLLGRPQELPHLHHRQRHHLQAFLTHKSDFY